MIFNPEKYVKSVILIGTEKLGLDTHISDPKSSLISVPSST